MLSGISKFEDGQTPAVSIFPSVPADIMSDGRLCPYSGSQEARALQYVQCLDVFVELVILSLCAVSV